MKIKSKFAAWEIIFLAAMFCFAISLFNKGGYIFAFLAVIVLFFNIRNIKVSLVLLSLILYSVLYFAFYTNLHGYSIENTVIYLIGPWAAYLMGKLYVEKSKNENAFWALLIILSSGMFLHGILNWLVYLRSDYYALYEYSRIAIDVWRNEIVSVTVTGMFYTFATGISLGVLFSKFNAKYKIIATFVLVTAVVVSVFFANRTLIVIVAIIVIWKLISMIFSKSVSMKTKVAIIIFLVVMLIAIAISLVFNLGGIADWFFSLKIVQRYDDSVGRLNAWLSIFEDGTWIKYPFGNPDNTYRHNLWLDVYGEVGVFPFLIVVCLTIYFIRRFFVFRSAMVSHNEKNTYIMFQCLCVAILLNCAVEPVIVANPYYFLIVLMFMGAMEGEAARVCRSN